MQRRGEEFRKNVLAVATELFYQQGFRATGMDDIAKKAECTKRSIYKHFESKDDLISEMLWERHTLWIEGLRESLELRSQSAKGKLLAWFDQLAQSLRQPSYRGCIFFNASIEFPCPPVSIQRVLHENTRAGHALLLELVTEAGAADPENAAQELGVIRRGAQISMSVTKDSQTGEYAKHAAIHVLHRHGIRVNSSELNLKSRQSRKELYV
jgi:AcrR family transcriptional regulator